ncbi:hypothetical protein BKG82_27015 [Mycobacteroides chelonae]|uniref:Uncharacterized protein n=2 Tax=Mycobacteroides chelonae TaxID=1774 RepID=A0A1S1LGN0_MYCCH|nr:hypothetical protein BKG82_27015 [Mycobacteroides chelonae]
MADDFAGRAAILDGLWPDVDPEAILAAADDLLSRIEPRLLLAVVLQDKAGQPPTPLAYLKVAGEKMRQRIYNGARSDEKPPASGAAVVYLQLLSADGDQVVEATAISRKQAARLLIQAAMASRQPGRFVATMLAASADTVIEHFQNNPLPKPGPDPERPGPR